MCERWFILSKRAMYLDKVYRSRRVKVTLHVKFINMGLNTGEDEYGRKKAHLTHEIFSEKHVKRPPLVTKEYVNYNYNFLVHWIEIFCTQVMCLFLILVTIFYCAKGFLAGVSDISVVSLCKYWIIPCDKPTSLSPVELNKDMKWKSTLWTKVTDWTSVKKHWGGMKRAHRRHKALEARLVCCVWPEKKAAVYILTFYITNVEHVCLAIISAFQPCTIVLCAI